MEPAVDAALILCENGPPTPSQLASWLVDRDGPSVLDAGDGFATVRETLRECGVTPEVEAAAIAEACRVPTLIYDEEAPGYDGELASTAGTQLAVSLEPDAAPAPQPPSVALPAPVADAAPSPSPASPPTSPPSTPPHSRDVRHRRAPLRPLSAASEALASRVDDCPCPRCFRPEAAAWLRSRLRAPAPQELARTAATTPFPSLSSASAEAAAAAVPGRPVACVVSLGGAVGWWVQRADVTTSTTRWVAAPGCRARAGYSTTAQLPSPSHSPQRGAGDSGSSNSMADDALAWSGSGSDSGSRIGSRSGSERSRGAAGELFFGLALLEQAFSTRWCADALWSASALGAASGGGPGGSGGGGGGGGAGGGGSPSTPACPAFDLCAGEFVVAVEQLVVPRGRAELARQAPRRGVARSRVEVLGAPRLDGGGAGPTGEVLDAGQEFDFERIEVSMRRRMDASGTWASGVGGATSVSAGGGESRGVRKHGAHV